MINLSKLKARVYGYGIFSVFLSQSLGPLNDGFGEVELFVPWMDPFPTPEKRWVGRNIPGIKRIWDFWEDLDSVDSFFFFDVGDADIQQELLRQGRAVFGTGTGKRDKQGDTAAEIEIDRVKFKKTLIKQGLAVPKWKVLTGIDELIQKAKKDPGFWVKPNVGERGIFETFFIENYESSKSKIDQIAHDLGVSRDVCEFMTERSIPGCEPGSDHFICRGVPFDVGLYGWENKGDSYLCRVMNMADMPPAVKRVNDAMAPVWKQYEFSAAISTEIRVGKDKLPYFEDGCLRMGNPPAASISEIYKNFPQICHGLARGEAVKPEFRAKYAAEISIDATGAEDEPVPFELEKDEWRRIKIRTACRVNGQYWHIPFKKNGSVIAKAVGLGKTKDEAQDNALEAAENFKCRGKSYNKNAFSALEKDFEEGEKYGVFKP